MSSGYLCGRPNHAGTGIAAGNLVAIETLHQQDVTIRHCHDPAVSGGDAGKTGQCEHGMLDAGVVPLRLDAAPREAATFAVLEQVWYLEGSVSV